MKENTFYDIHMHAFNLSHPYFSAFVKRFRIHQLLTVVAIISILTHIPILRRLILFLINRMLRRVRNLLAVMENDIGSFLLVTENCLREDENQLLKNDGLYIGGKVYKKIVLTPLMMDFGLKGIKEDKTIHYGRPSEKPIVEQVTDVFNAIKKYKNAKSSAKLAEKYPSLGSGTNRVFEIYPFLGLNTKIYDISRIEKMLYKYFGSYTGLRDDLLANMGKFDGDIEQIGSNFFAGIKVYPPLDFDPWPDDKNTNEDAMELLKVIYLYQYCSDKGIPITAHSSEGGFVTINREQRKNYTAISKWEKVLKHYPNLKLNLAHLPMREKILMIFPNFTHPRLNAILRIVLNNENVYVDFSNRAINDKYYKSLRKVIDNLPVEQKTKLTERILFGSDFTVNLMSIESYNKYLDIFSQTGYLTPEEKDSFCCTNPERFLFP